MTLPKPLELIFAEKLIEEFDFYNMSTNHCKSKPNSTNKYPYVKFDIRDFIWDIKTPDDDDISYTLEQRIWEDWQRDWEEIYQPDCEECCDVEITTDMNAYKILILNDLNDLKDQREDLECDLEKLENWLEDTTIEKDSDEIEDVLNDMNSTKEECEDVDKQIIECAKQLRAFKLWFEKFKECVKQEFKEKIIVVDDDGNYDFVNKDWFEDMKDEYNWRNWSEDNVIEEMSKEKEKEFVNENIFEVIKKQREILLNKINDEWVERCINSMEI